MGKEIINEWWLENYPEGKMAIVYTENLKVKELGKHLMAEYFDGTKLSARQFIYLHNSEEFKAIKKKLNLTEANRKKETRERKKKKREGDE